MSAFSAPVNWRYQPSPCGSVTASDSSWATMDAIASASGFRLGLLSHWAAQEPGQRLALPMKAYFTAVAPLVRYQWYPQKLAQRAPPPIVASTSGAPTTT